MKRYIQVAILVVCCFVFVKTAVAQHARIPEIAMIDITNDHIRFQFEWIGEDPGFQEDEAVEFEVIVMTDNEKCFAQPPTGRDDRIDRAQNNFPASHGLEYGYTDVWNYWNPPREIRVAEVESYCGAVGVFCTAGLLTVTVADVDANFAVGTINPHLFKAGVRYWFFYPLEPTDRPECQGRENRLAWTQISMTSFPEICSLCQTPSKCVHLIGLEAKGTKCPEINNETRTRKSLIKRLCVNGDNVSDGFYTFTPDSSIEGKGECCDYDQDGYFRLFRDQFGTDLPMFGHRVGDCDDNPNNPGAELIHNELYNSELGICNSDEELDCTNDQDDDYDGLTDCHDPDCTFDPNCLISCTPICNAGEFHCNGNNVERCAANECEYEYLYPCSSNQTCVNGACITPTVPKPEITSVSCTSYFRGDTNVTCTIYGSNFDCGLGSNTFIGGGYYSGPAQSCTSTQLVVSLNWICGGPIGLIQVSHRNPDNQRDDEYNLLEVLMGELTITSAWQPVVHEGATNVPMGANGCNFGQNVVLWVGGVAIANTILQAEDQVLGDGAVVGSANDPPSDLCVAKYSGAQIGFDKKCLWGHVTIVP